MKQISFQTVAATLVLILLWEHTYWWMWIPVVWVAFGYLAIQIGQLIDESKATLEEAAYIICFGLISFVMVIFAIFSEQKYRTNFLKSLPYGFRSPIYKREKLPPKED